MNHVTQLLSRLPFLKKKEMEEDEELFEPLSPADQELLQDDDILDVTPEPAPKEKKSLLSFLHSSKNKAPKPSKKEAVPKRKDNPHPKPKRGQQILSVLVLFALAALLFFLWSAMNRSTEPKQTTEPKAKSVSADAQTTSLSRTDGIFINPFVDKNRLTSLPKDENGQPTLDTGSRELPSTTREAALPAIPSSRQDSVQATVPRVSPALPAIPSANVPTTPVPAPSLPDSFSTTPQPSGNQNANEVQGVLTGDDGSGMAIMGDGSILSAGDSYNDGRIAYIGGDGIHFEDGSTLKYGE